MAAGVICPGADCPSSISPVTSAEILLLSLVDESILLHDRSLMIRTLFRVLRPSRAMLVAWSAAERPPPGHVCPRPRKTFVPEPISRVLRGIFQVCPARPDQYFDGVRRPGDLVDRGGPPG